MITVFTEKMKKLLAEKSGLAFIEFAYSLPIFLGIGMYGSEIANLTLQKTALAQVAVSLSDNASRMGSTVNDDISKTIYEGDVRQLIAGAVIQAGSLKILENGRIIVSSLEVNANGKQKIAWQRCKGKAVVPPKYGSQGKNGSDDSSFVGMGRPGNEIQALAGDAVMYVEITYDYQPLFGDMFIKSTRLFEEAAYNVRDSRDLASGLRSDGNDPALCSKYNANI